MTDTDKTPQQTINQCFEEIKQVLRKYDCEIYTCDDGEINICSANGVDKYYLSEDFNK